MIKLILTILLPLIAPTVLYFFWMKLRRHKAKAMATGEPLPEWEKLPWPWLIGGGCILTVVSLLIIGIPSTHDRDSIYVPPRMEDGVLVPGHFEDAPTNEPTQQ
ncbi:DUF6111 family protein [Aestuariispira insulae]|uniref:Uncharacterized protein n=1 Tax=Aestuariispira insulae TaxID=1461337 RepID=A0A3D9HFJ8_9PROT|nr:DUF6111 family protein [Aestuariispira insulae]RED48021.1 hypothetical protein DFP90_10838 [Aestuariispira insulae]